MPLIKSTLNRLSILVVNYKKIFDTFLLKNYLEFKITSILLLIYYKRLAKYVDQAVNKNK